MDDLIVKHVVFKVDEMTKDGYFEGYAATYGNIDQGKDVCVEGCFDKSIALHKKNGTMPGMFYAHDMKEPVGDWLSMDSNKRGLKMAGQLWVGKGIPKVEQAHMLMKSKMEKGLSIGAKMRDHAYDEKKGVRNLLELDLKEVSPTIFPMNQKAIITTVKSLMLEKASLTIREAEELLRDVGFSITDAKSFLGRLQLGLKQRDAADDELRNLANKITNILKG